MTITIAIIAFAIVACKKNDDSKHKCYWAANKGNLPIQTWLKKPSDDQFKKVKDSCACIVTLEEYCYSCDLQVSTPGGEELICQ